MQDLSYKILSCYNYSHTSMVLFSFKNKIPVEECSPELSVIATDVLTVIV